MDDLMMYISELVKIQEAGLLDDYPSPGDPPDLGSPLTQDEIDFVKKFKKEIEERFITPP